MTYKSSQRFRYLILVVNFCGIVALMLLPNNVQAQKHHLSSGSDAPGMIAQKKILEDPRLAGFVQPVQIYTPRGSLVSMWSTQGYGVGHDSVVSVGLTIGQVYRARVESIPRFPGKELYPSIEVIDRLHAPQGMEKQFPIQVVISQDDLEKALSGRLVTKVIYLEDSDKSLPYRPIRDDQPYFDIGPSEDVLRTAEGLGRPVAVVRIGSRVPINEEFVSGRFGFNSGPVFAMQAPVKDFEEGFENILGDNQVSNLVPDVPEANVPPIVPGATYRSQRVQR